MKNTDIKYLEQQTKKYTTCNKLTNKAIITWLVVGLFCCFQFCTQVSAGPMTRELMQYFNLDAVAISYVVSSFFYVFLIMQLPAGIMLDRFSTRYLITIMSAVCALGCFMMSFVSANNYGLALFVLARMICGLGAAFGFIGTMRTIRNYIPLKYITLFIGLTELIGFVATAAFEHSISHFLPILGFKDFLFYFSLIGFAVSLIIYIMLGAKFVPKYEYAPPVTSNEHNLIKDLSELVFNKQLWILGLLGFCFFSIVTSFAALWGVPCLVNIHGLSVSTSTQIVSCLFLGIATGGPLIAIISSRKNNISDQRYLIFFCGIISAVLLSYFLYFKNINIYMLYIIFYALGILCCCYLLSFSIAGEIISSRLNASAMGFINMITMASALVMQPVMGYLVALDDPIDIINGAPIYTSYSYQRAGVALVVLYLIACLLSTKLRNKTS